MRWRPAFCVQFRSSKCISRFEEADLNDASGIFHSISYFARSQRCCCDWLRPCQCAVKCSDPVTCQLPVKMHLAISTASFGCPFLIDLGLVVAGRAITVWRLPVLLARASQS
jgi:hypothetical protein